MHVANLDSLSSANSIVKLYDVENQKGSRLAGYHLVAAD
jgi:hypothetical protein